MHAERERAQAARVEDARAREHLGIARARVLRQVAELARAVDPAVRGQQIAGEHLGQRRLAGSVAADEAHLVAVADAERDVRHEHAGAHADLEVVHGEHSEGPFRRGSGESGRTASLPVYVADVRRSRGGRAGLMACTADAAIRW